MNGDGHRDGSGLAQTLRLGGLVAGVGPTAHTLGSKYVALLLIFAPRATGFQILNYDPTATTQYSKWRKTGGKIFHLD